MANRSDSISSSCFYFRIHALVGPAAVSKSNLRAESINEDQQDYKERKPLFKVVKSVAFPSNAEVSVWVTTSSAIPLYMVSNQSSENLLMFLPASGNGNAL